MRPKSAVMINVPYRFPSKEQAYSAKQQLKRCFRRFDHSLDEMADGVSSLYSSSAYIDRGPSLFISSTTWTGFLNQKRNSIPRLKPCRVLRPRSVNHISHSIQTANADFAQLKTAFAQSPRKQRPQSSKVSLGIFPTSTKIHTLKKVPHYRV